jgi:preprotein translocase subunit SecE
MILKADKQAPTRFDWLKWSLTVILLLAGMIANHYYSEVSLPIRTIVWLAILALSGFILSYTQKGRWAISFCHDARTELRKVVWPTRDETLQTTLVVAVMVIILSLLLWGIDGGLVWVIGWLTGQRS